MLTGVLTPEATLLDDLPSPSAGALRFGAIFSVLARALNWILGGWRGRRCRLLSWIRSMLARRRWKSELRERLSDQELGANDESAGNGDLSPRQSNASTGTMNSTCG